MWSSVVSEQLLVTLVAEDSFKFFITKDSHFELLYLVEYVTELVLNQQLIRMLKVFQIF